MATLTIRNLSEETYRALKVRAASNRRSIPAEVREILGMTVLPSDHVKPGTLLARIGRNVGLTDNDCASFDKLRDKSVSGPANLP